MFRFEPARVLWDRKTKNKIINIKDSHIGIILERHIKVVHDEGFNDELTIEQILKKEKEMNG